MQLRLNVATASGENAGEPMLLPLLRSGDVLDRAYLSSVGVHVRLFDVRQNFTDDI